MARTTSRHRCTPSRPCHTNRKVAAIFQQYYSGGGGGSGEAKLYLTSDRCVFAAPAGSSDDYLSFPCAVGNQDGAQYTVYYRGTGHNQANHSIRFRKKTAGVWGAEVQLATGIQHVTNPWILKTTTGRLVAGYDRIPSNRLAFVILSDDDGETWTEEVLLESEQDEGGNMEGLNLGGQGDGVVMEDGTLLKAMWSEGVGGPTGYLYKSEDNGETWTRVNIIWATGSGFIQEPCLCLLPSGRLVCSARNDTTNIVSLYYLDSMAGSWQGPIASGVPSISKSPVAFAHDMLIMLGRWDGNNGRPFVSFTKDLDTLSGWSAPLQLSERITSHMYGSIVPTTNGFQLLYSQGVFEEDTPSVSGPAFIIEKDITVSTTPVAESPRYSQAYRVWLDITQGNGIGIPSSNLIRDLHNTLFEFFIDDELWDKIVGGNLFAMADANLGSFARWNFRKPWRWANSAVNNPVYDKDGYDFDGSTQYVNTGFIPNTHGGSIFTQNDAGVYVVIKDDVLAANNFDFGASNGNFSTQNRGPQLNSRNASGNLTFQLNDDTNTTYSNSNSDGRYFLQRINQAENNKKLWRDIDGEFTNVLTATVASVGRSVNSVYVGCGHFADVPGRFSSRGVKLILFTSGLSGLEAQLDARMNWYLTELEGL